MAAMKIGEIARRAGCPIETVRYYERQGLLPAPTRTDGNYRVYAEADVERLAFIRHCRALDMTLAEIAALLTFWDDPERHCNEVNLLLDAHIGHVAERISELSALKEQLVELRRLCRKSRKSRDCGILKRLGRGPRARAGTGAVHSPRRGS